LLVLFLLFDNCIWFFWKLIVLGYLLGSFVLSFVAVCFCLVAMSGGVGCAVGAWVDVLLGCLFWVFWLGAWLFWVAEKCLVRVMSLWKFV
jgi:hypothetical protein